MRTVAPSLRTSSTSAWRLEVKLTVALLLGLLIAGLLALRTWQDYRRFHRPLLTTTFQAVTFVDGRVLYGRIDHLGSDHPVLREAFSVHGDGDKLTSSWLRDGPTGADHVVFPASAVLTVQPVAPESPVGRLIAASRRR